MPSTEVQRTLVKSPPELWAELSDPETLARHLGAFGEIRITRLQPETTVAWEGERVSGAVELEQSGWGTKVTLSVEEAEAEPEPELVVEPEPEPEPVPEPVLTERRRFWARFFRRRYVAEPEPVVEPVVIAEVPPRPDPAPEPPDPDPIPDPLPPEPGVEQDPIPAAEVLTGVLDTLGAAHHRPFSRG
jgi:hypothetical protein